MKSLLRLKPYLRPYLWLIVCSGLLAIPLAALRTGPAPLAKYFLDQLNSGEAASQLLLFPALVIALYSANFVVRFLHYYLLRVVIARVNQRIKNELFNHLLGLSADYYTSQATGTLISRVGSDPQYVDHGLAAINMIFREPVTFVFVFGYALYLDVGLTLITILVLPFLALVFSATGRNLKRYIARMTEENGRLFSTIQESFTGIRMVKSYQLEDYVGRKFQERNSSYARFYLKTSLLEEAAHPMVELLTAFAIAGVIYYGGTQVVDGRMTSGELFAFFVALGLMMNPLRMMNEINIRLHQSAAACERIFEIFDWKSNLYVSPNPRSIDRLEHEVRLDNVVFSYPDAPERDVLKGVSFAVPKGAVVALVGASGAGKSSIINLLARIFDVKSGKIMIDGVDIRELDLRDLRKMIAVVSQDIFLFNDTIEENIRCGRLGATHEEIREAARRANALDFIESLPDGFNTSIGERGQKLSGGERQRVSIARAFLREAPILILDEATSNLDTASERAVQKALDELMKNRTAIVIAHRLTTIQSASQILVLKEGRVIESGRHEELIRNQGEYARFHLLASSASAVTQ